jgi:hypothetical protein
LRINCLLKNVFEEKIGGRLEVMGRRERRHKQLLDDRKERRRYWKLKEETPEQFVENWLWKRLWTCHKTDYTMNQHAEKSRSA